MTPTFLRAADPRNAACTLVAASSSVKLCTPTPRELNAPHSRPVSPPYQRIRLGISTYKLVGFTAAGVNETCHTVADQFASHPTPAQALHGLHGLHGGHSVVCGRSGYLGVFQGHLRDVWGYLGRIWGVCGIHLRGIWGYLWSGVAPPRPFMVCTVGIVVLVVGLKAILRCSDPPADLPSSQY